MASAGGRRHAPWRRQRAESLAARTCLMTWSMMIAAVAPEAITGSCLGDRRDQAAQWQLPHRISVMAAAQTP